MDWLKSTGKIIYDPEPKSSKLTKKNKRFDPWWVILSCDNEIVRYYNYWLEKRGIRIHWRSLFHSHVSIVKGGKDEPLNKDLWKSRHGEMIEFEYNNIIHDNGSHWWIWARCPEFSEIRKELGLDPIPDVNFHLTIGRSMEKY